MPAEKKMTTRPLVADGAKIGEPVPRAVVDVNTASIGIPPQPEFNAEEEIGLLLSQVEILRRQVADASAAVKTGASVAVRQTKATVKLYPVSSLVTVAAVAAIFGLAIAGRLQASARQSTYDRALDDMRDLYDKIRGRF
jgi:hypothetical protein